MIINCQHGHFYCSDSFQSQSSFPHHLMLFIKHYHVQFLIFLRVLQKLFTICVSRVPWWNFNFMHDDFHINSYSHVLCDHRLIRLILYIPKYLNIHHWLEIDQIRTLEVKLKNMNEWMKNVGRDFVKMDIWLSFLNLSSPSAFVNEKFQSRMVSSSKIERIEFEKYSVIDENEILV